MHILNLKNAAEKWDNGTPVGNGHMGFMLMGGVNTEKLYLCEESIWSDKKEKGLDENFKHKIDHIRKLYLENKPVEAEKWAIENLKDDFHTIASYEYAGILSLQFTSKARYSCYERKLNLNEAIAEISYKQNNATVTREAFSSYVDKIMAYRIHSEKKHGFTISFERECVLKKEAKDNTMTVVCNTAIGDHPFCLAVKVCTNGACVAVNDSLIVSNADDTVIWMSIVTSYRESNFEAICQQRLDVANEGYDTIKKRHIEDFSNAFNRSDIQFEESNDKLAQKEVNKRLTRLKLNPGAKDHSLAALYFSFGKYLLLSSSRPGSLPANLQGIWVEKMLNPWNADYHTNINLQMNYWPAQIANLQDCVTPLFDYMNQIILPNGCKTAQVNYGARGLVVHHLSDLYGFTAAADGIWGLWPMGGAWLAFHMWEHYLFTKDTEFLKNTAYDYIKNAALFFIDTMFEGNDGYLHSGPSTSPENNYYIGKETCNMCLSPTMDIEIIGGLFDFYIKTEEILGIDPETASIAKEKRAKMPPLQIGKHGQLMEWLEDYDEPEPGHRHISHAFALYPDSAINRNTPELFAAIRKTFERRLSHGGGHTGWSRAWLLCLFARLHDSKAFEKNLRALFTKSTLNNLLDTHPPFQIDGNFGATAAICEALVQGHEGVICLLPAIGTDRTGSFRGLLAQGGYEVSCQFTNGRVNEIEIKPSFDGDIRIELPFTQKGALINGKKADAKEVYTFPCIGNQIYTFKVN